MDLRKMQKILDLIISVFLIRLNYCSQKSNDDKAVSGEEQLFVLNPVYAIELLIIMLMNKTAIYI